MASKLLGVIGAASLLLAGSAAAAQSAAPLSLTNAARAGAEISDSSELRGPTKYILGAIAVALLIFGAIELFSDNEEAFPNSP